MGGTFGSKLTFSIGSAYLGFGLAGFLFGMMNIKKPKFKLISTKLKCSYYLNHMVHNGLRYANNAGGAVIIYCGTGYILTKTLEDELSFLSNTNRNLMIGFLSGALYKSTLGY